MPGARCVLDENGPLTHFSPANRTHVEECQVYRGVEVETESTSKTVSIFQIESFKIALLSHCLPYIFAFDNSETWVGRMTANRQKKGAERTPA